MKKILVVDDHSFVTAFYSMAFKNHPYEIIFAGDGEEALRQAAAAKPDLILMDVSMPKLDGVEVTRRLRAQPAFRTTPILAVTARPWDDYLAGAGFTEYLKKPVTVTQLREALKRHLGLDSPLPA